MATIPAPRTRTTLPIMLIGQLVFACGLAVEEPMLSFLGLVIFLGTYMISSALRGPARIVAPRPALNGDARRRARPSGAIGLLRDDALHRHLPAPLGVDRAQPTQPTTNTAWRDAARDMPGLRLLPIVPLQDGTASVGWIGGNPNLPAKTDWPEIDGKPAQFIAQLDCAALPPELWNGKAPRSGWLAVFRSANASGRPLVLHNPTLGGPRQPPEPQRIAGLTPRRDDLLARVTGRAATPPRWPVAIARPYDDAVAQAGAETRAPDPSGSDPLGRAFPGTESPNLSDPGARPFDWTSALLLIEVILCDLDWQHQVVSLLGTADAQEARLCAFLDNQGTVSAAVEDLKSELTSAHATGLPFSDAVCALMFEALGRLEVDSGIGPGGVVAGDGSETPVMEPLLANGQIRRDYLYWLDRHATHLYTEAPAALPAAQRVLFEGRWARQAQCEAGLIGGPLPEGFANTAGSAAPLPLLRLPSSALMDWQFGNRGNFGVYLDARSMENGRFSDAFGDPAG